MPAANTDFPAALAELEGVFSKTGARTVHGPAELAKLHEDDIAVRLEVQSLGPVTKSTTGLGETLTRKVAVRLTDARSGKLLAGTAGASLTAISNENLDAQLVRSVMESIQTLAPGLIRP